MSQDLACRDLVELVTDYLEGTLDPQARRRFEEHLDECDGCAAYLDQMRETVRLTGTLPAESVGSPGFEALLTAFRGWKR